MMGLDMFAYSAMPDTYKGEVDFKVLSKREANSELQPGDADEDANSKLHYWRKHNALHGWMENLYRMKGGKEDDFNCVNLNLTFSDIMQLEYDIKHEALPETEGSFFGSDSRIDYESKHMEDDLEFIKDAKRALDAGQKVYYTSWW